MFGLSAREVLSKAIINASINCKDIYKNAIIENLETLNTEENEDTISSLMLSIRKEYLDAVANNVISSFSVSSPAISAKLQLIMMSPKMCGYEDINIDNGIMAGSLYAMCYYALKNKIASSQECIKLNHIQNDIMTEVLIELNNEL